MTINKRSDIQLFKAVIEPRFPGAIQRIKSCCANSANPNLMCIETSTSHGLVRGGFSLLTYSIHEGSSRAVEALLECGADPNMKDELGWSPWAASTVAFDKKDRIQSLLKEYGAVEEGDHIGSLCRAIAAGNVKAALTFIKSSDDLKLLAEFRVDLIAHQIRQKQSEMLNFLLENGMHCEADQLYRAVSEKYLPAVELLLAHGIHPDRPNDNETILMLAASLGQMEVVRMLVEAGADVHRYANNNIEWTASFYANRARHKEVAKWLNMQMSESFIKKQNEHVANRNPKFRNLYKNGTSSEGLSTDDIVKVLEKWDEKYGLMIKRSSSDSVIVQFDSLPENIKLLLNEIFKLCPDLGQDKKAVQTELEKKKIIMLWWD